MRWHLLVIPQGPGYPTYTAILAFSQGFTAAEVPPSDTIRASITSEIAGSIFLVLLLQVGGAFAVATYFGVIPRPRDVLAAYRDDDVHSDATSSESSDAGDDDAM
jgi:hypothetical protein